MKKVDKEMMQRYAVYAQLKEEFTKEWDYEGFLLHQPPTRRCENEHFVYRGTLSEICWQIDRGWIKDITLVEEVSLR